MNKMILETALIFLLISFFPACSEQKVADKQVTTFDMEKCVCIQLWMPVCGENKKTYSNSCFAKCAGVKYTQGSCSKTITD